MEDTEAVLTAAGATMVTVRIGGSEHGNMNSNASGSGNSSSRPGPMASQTGLAQRGTHLRMLKHGFIGIKSPDAENSYISRFS